MSDVQRKVGYLDLILGWSLALCGTAFGLLALFFILNAGQVMISWPDVQAYVRAVSVESIADNKFGLITIEFHYSTASGEKTAWARVTGLPYGGKSFLQEYAVGSPHKIRLNPSDVRQAELEIGWNVHSLYAPTFTGCLCLLLFLASRHFLRNRQKRPHT